MSNENRSVMVARNVLSGVGVVVGIVAGSGCGSLTKPNPLSCLDGYCSDQAHPFCDVDGSFSGKPGLCIAVDCEPLAFEACRGDEAIVCNATGDDYDLTHCEFGCSDDAHGCKQCTPGTPGCNAHIIPKYLPTVCDQLATENTLTISTPTTLDTSLDATCNGGVVAQPGAPEICVLRYGSIVIARNTTLTIRGKRAVALVSDQALTVDGVLDLSAEGIVDGPGGGLASSGVPGDSSGGSGGAGFRTEGGRGGGGAAAGPSVPDPAQLAVLIGGVHANPPPNFSPAGGGGGGAAVLVSCRNAVAMPGVIDAGGGGGRGGNDVVGYVAPGGGGSGGYVVLQGMEVNVTGEAYANGGGGGAGLDNGTGFGRGSDGLRSPTMAAAGGLQRGGAGGVNTTAPGNGQSDGSGGGSVGFFQAYTPTGVSAHVAPVAASPGFQANLTVATKRD